MLVKRTTASVRSSATRLLLIVPILFLALGAGKALAVCDCPNVGDVNADGSINVLDMAKTLDYLLNGGPGPTQDPSCPTVREDFNADGVVDIRDIAAIRTYIFLGGDPLLQPCDCGVTPSLCEPVVDPTTPEFLATHCDDDLFLSVKEGLEYQKNGYPLLVNVWGIFEMSQFEKNDSR